MAVVEQSSVPEEDGLRVKGDVEFWRASEGFGGVMPLGWTHDAPRFRAADVLASLLPRLYPGMPVEFELRQGQPGKLKATRITHPGMRLLSTARVAGRVRSFERGFGFVAPEDELAALLAGAMGLLYFHRSALQGPLSACVPGAPVTFVMVQSRKKAGEYEASDVRLVGGAPEKSYNDDERAPLGGDGNSTDSDLDALTTRMATLAVKSNSAPPVSGLNRGSNTPNGSSSTSGAVDLSALLVMPGTEKGGVGMGEAQTLERLQLVWQESIAALHVLLLALPAPELGTGTASLQEAPLQALPDAFGTQRTYYWAYAPPLITELQCAIANGAATCNPTRNRLYRPTQVETVRLHGSAFTLMHLIELRSAAVVPSQQADGIPLTTDDEADDITDDAVVAHSTEGMFTPGDVLLLRGRIAPVTATLPSASSGNLLLRPAASVPVTFSSSSSSSSSFPPSSTSSTSYTPPFAPMLALVHRARAPTLSVLLPSEVAPLCEQWLASYKSSSFNVTITSLPATTSNAHANANGVAPQQLELHGPLHNVVPHQRLYAALRAGVLTGDVPPFLHGLIAPRQYSSALAVANAWADDVAPPLMRALEERLNKAQMEAVQRLVALSEGVLLIQGPPGTGKSTTILALLSVLLTQGARPLVCSPANAAVDELVTRISRVGLLTGNATAYHPPIALVAAPERVDTRVAALAAALLPPRRAALMAHLTALRQALPRLASLLRHAETALAPPPPPPPANTKDTRDTKDSTKKDGKAEVEEKTGAEKAVEEADLVERIAEQRDELVRLCDLHASLGHAFAKDSTHAWANRLRLSPLKSALVALLPTLASTPVPSLASLSALHLPELAAQLRTVAGSVGELRDEMEKPGEALEVEILNQSRIVFSTLVASGRLLLRRPSLKPFDVLIVDEAAQALEPETLIALRASVRRLILVGDPRQLPATVFSPAAVAAHFDRPMMTRLMEAGVTAVFLNVQHRMAPDISLWPAKRFYASRLLNAPNVSLPAWAAPSHAHSPCAYVFVNVLHAREVRDDLSLSVHSPTEADECLRILRSLHTSGAGAGLSVGLITFYAAQVRQLRERLAREGAAWAAGVQVATVDAFQGQEKDVIVLSFVRGNVHGTVGFLRDMRRLNVALTRARRLLVLVGHASTLRAHPDLADLLDDAASRNLLVYAASPSSALPELSLRPATTSLRHSSLPLASSSNSSTSRDGSGSAGKRGARGSDRGRGRGGRGAQQPPGGSTRGRSSNRRGGPP